MQKDLLEPERLKQVATHILNSPYLYSTTLNEGFKNSDGFSITFTRKGLEKLYKTFPYFTEYLDKVLQDNHNAFFLNPLVVYKGNGIRPHIDFSLNPWCAPHTPPFPYKVSVLYLQVPEKMKGGNFVIQRWLFKKTVHPQDNLLLEFQGDLKHGVSPILESDQNPRVSLVLESYELPKYLLEKIPDFHLKSNRPFENFLEEAQGEP